MKQVHVPWVRSGSGLTLPFEALYHIGLTLQDLWQQSIADAEPFLKRWYFRATHSRLEPVIRVAKTLREHRHRVLRWYDTLINNDVLEGINSLIQAAKAKAP